MAAFPALFGLFLVAVVTGQAVVEITPERAVRRVGDQLTVVSKVNYPIDSCRVILNKTSYRLIPDNSGGDVIYAGKGLQFGECGVLLKDIKEDWNGPITFYLPPNTGSAIETTATMQLVVARAPGTPELLAPLQPFREGDIFEAQCSAPLGRPAAKISWFLDNEPLLTGLHTPILTPHDGDLVTVSQNLSRLLSPDDDGRQIACRVEHEALDAPRETSRQISVRYQPRAKEGESNTQTIFGLALNSEGRLTVSVRAAPAPRAAWTVGGARLTAPAQSADGELMALEPQAEGNGYYNITLVLRRVTKESVDRVYKLIASNEEGESEFTLRISTMDEPAGVELDTGAIVGIVLAVLILLAAISLLVFAKATERWCFGGPRGVRDHTKSSGESTPAGDVLLTGVAVKTSDTESAATQRRDPRARLRELGARVRAALPRGRDKVQATDGTGEEDKTQDEKKSVVYAELALSDQPPGDKPPPATTDYAEIVYNQQKETKE